MNYGEIINRIKKIIEKSNNSQGKKIVYGSFKVLEENYGEFKYLMETERVWFELSNSIDEYIQNNVKLIESTKSITKEGSVELVEELINILNGTSGLTPIDLALFDKYVIPKNKKNEFAEITKKLHIGPYVPIANIKKEETIKYLNHNNKKRKEQFDRIKNQVKNNNEEDLEKNEFLGSNKILLTLFNEGKLKKDALSHISKVTNFIEYKELLLDLKKFLVLTEEEYEHYYSLRTSEPVLIDTLDELVTFFTNSKDITVEGILSLKEYFSEEILDDLIFELFKNGTLENVEFNEYINMKYIEIGDQTQKK